MDRTRHENTVDEHVVRAIAAMVAVLAAASLLPGLSGITALLAADFFIRGWVNPDLSPLCWLSRRIVGLTGLDYRPVYAPPKRFATRIGAVIAGLAAVLQFGPETGATVVTLMLVLAAGLEAVAGFCIACWVFPYAQRMSERVRQAGTRG